MQHPIARIGLFVLFSVIAAAAVAASMRRRRSDDQTARYEHACWAASSG